MDLEANPNSVIVVDNQGSTPLHPACWFSGINIVKYLVTANEGALETCNSRGEYPLQIACQVRPWGVLKNAEKKSLSI